MTGPSRATPSPRAHVRTLVDWVFAAFLATSNIVTMHQEKIVPGLRPPNVRDAALAALIAVPVVVRRRGPLGALALTCLGTIVLIGTNAPEGSVVFTVAFLTYYVAATSPIGRATMGLLAVFVTLACLSALDTPGMNTLGVARFSAVFSIVWAVGIAVRARREAAAARLRNEAERAENAIERAARSVAEERLRIAQELHDVVAHSISVIAVQAGVGTHFVRSDSLKTDAALKAIRLTAQSTLNELRRMLGVLRSDGETHRMPSPSLDQLGHLVGEVRSLGVAIELQLDYPSAGTHPGLEMSVYRVIQESLTNVLRHAGHTTAVSVKVQQGANALVVEVTDDGDGTVDHERAGQVTGSGLGLLGMRERVEVWGGKVDFGPRTPCGFAVRASFPIEATA